ncbi:MAG: aminomethyltransferase beta-barrel domain-containing protein, partial [Kineosporiaceae bacterium]
EPVPAVAAGQTVALYEGTRVLGAGTAAGAGSTARVGAGSRPDARAG